MGTLRGEALLATTGVTAALRPGPIRINQEVLGKAQGIERTIQRKLRRFVRAPEFSPMPDAPPFDYDEIMSLLPHAKDEVRQVENVSGFYDNELAVEYADVLGTAVGYIISVAPMEPLPAMVGHANMQPSGTDVSEFQRRYSTVDVLMSLFDEMAAGPLTPDQVEAFAACYPNLYASARQMLMKEMIEAGAAKQSWSLPYAKDQVLQVFLQTEVMSPELHAELGKVFDDQREKESGQKTGAAPSPSGRKGIGDPSTQSQRLETK